MQQNRIRQSAYVESEFITTYLSVFTELIGAKHEFTLRGHRVMVSLPSLSEVKREWEEYCRAKWDSWRTIDGQDVPCYYNIFRIDVKVQAPTSVKIHPEMLLKPCKATGLLDASEEAALSKLCNDLDDIVAEAFEHWCSVMRWVTSNFKIGREHIQAKSNSAPYLRLCEGGRRVWAPPMVLNIEGTHHVTPAEWEAARAILESGKVVPAHIALLLDAEDYLRRHDYRRSMIDIAIAAEVFLRSAVLKTLPSSLSPKIRSSVESIGVAKYLNQFFPDVIDPSAKREFKELSTQLESLFKARNKIVHMADHQRATREECSRFIDVNKRLFKLVSNISE